MVSVSVSVVFSVRVSVSVNVWVRVYLQASGRGRVDGVDHRDHISAICDALGPSGPDRHKTRDTYWM